MVVAHGSPVASPFFIPSSLPPSSTRHSANRKKPHSFLGFRHLFILWFGFDINFMKLHTLTALFLSTAALSGTYAQPNVHHRHHSHPEGLVARVGELGKRQANGSSSSSAPATSPATTTSKPASSSSGLAATPGAATTSGTGSTTATGPAPTPVVSVPAQGANGAPPLSSISSGMPTGTPLPVSPTYAPGASPPISGAPPLPSKCTVSCFFFLCFGRCQVELRSRFFFWILVVFNSADWPAQDKIPDTCGLFIVICRDELSE